MNISFDLDGTLIPYNNEFETERLGKLASFFGVEAIRKGTIELFNKLNEEGHIISLYTTSFRTKRKIIKTFNYYNLNVNKIINQKQNEKKLKLININSSKFPPAFGFDVHIDDAKGVLIEGEKFNFEVIIIAPNELNWIEKVIKGINEIKS